MKPTKKSWQVLPCLVLISSSLFAQWNKNAGINIPLTSTATASATSTANTNLASNAIDGKENTIWESENTLPYGFVSNQTQNVLLGLTSSPNSNISNPANLTDGDFNTPVNISTNSNGNGYVYLPITSPSKLSVITLKGVISSGNITITVFEPNGDSSVIGQYGGASNYIIEKYFTSKIVSKIKLSGNSAFIISEIAAAGPSLFEDLNLDLGASRKIGWIYLRAYAVTAADSIAVFGSTDNVNWKKLANPDPNNYFTGHYKVPSSTQARYLKVRTYMKLQDYVRAQVSEISVYDEHGIYGEFPVAKPAKRPLKDMIGINGIWGWGTQDYSDNAGQNKATDLYSRVATHARNYHEMEWDVADPDITPVYNGMPGSLHKNWLDWDREYQTWKNSGMEVQTSIQFTTTWLPQYLWNNPYQAAYNYGYAFANYFGPTNGNGLVKTMEVGNEPWDYDSTFYQEVLRGMASGAKAADPAMEVFSCALQSSDPTKEASAAERNYMGTRLTASAAPYLDGLNVHHYSYISDPATGLRLATHPENPASTMRGIVSDIRFRDANMPGTKILMSEWGWDSDGANEPCYHNECVTEEAQAMYAIRGLLMLDRLGVDRATWYFYANLPLGSSLYTRSGLTGTSNSGFAPKKSFYAIEHMLEKMGDSYFLEVIAEDEDTWAYVYGDSTGKPTHVVAWRPVDANDGSTRQLEIKRGYIADSAWVYDGLANVPAQATLTKNKNGEMLLDLGAAPMLIKLDSSATSNVSLNDMPVVKNHMAIYPNPNSGNFSIKLNMNEGGDVTTRMYSIDGRSTYQLQNVAANAGTTIAQFQVDGLAPGVYIFEASKSDGSFAERRQIVITP